MGLGRDLGGIWNNGRPPELNPRRRRYLHHAAQRSDSADLGVGLGARLARRRDALCVGGARDSHRERQRRGRGIGLYDDERCDGECNPVVHAGGERGLGPRGQLPDGRRGNRCGARQPRSRGARRGRERPPRGERGEQPALLVPGECLGPHVGDQRGLRGTTPISIAVHDNLVYVVNGGSGGSISGFWLTSGGVLTPIAGSTQALSAGAVPAQVSFDPTGQVLVVTEKATSLIDTFTVDANGIASGVTSYASSGATPFGFAFDNKGHLIVSEAAVAALSSYAVSPAGVVTTISGSVVDGQGAACWVVISNNGKFAYTSNAHDPFNDISSYAVGGGGTLTLLQVNAAAPGL